MEFLRTWGPDFDQKRGREGGRDRWGGSICAWKLYIILVGEGGENVGGGGGGGRL